MKTIKSILSLFILTFAVAVHAQDWTSGLNSGGSYPQTSTDVTEASGSSTVVVGTYTRGTAVFGSKTLDWVSQYPSDPTNMTPNGFIVKYSLYNSVLWATRIPAAGGVIISSVTADASGNIYVCGTYSYICEFYNASSPNAATPVTTLPSSTISPVSAERRGFIAKYSSSGLLQWARRGLGDSEVITDIAVSEDKTQLAVTGRVYTADPGSGVTTGSYVLWLDPATGNTVRAYNYSDSYTYTSINKTGLCIDHANNVIVSGRMEGTSYLVKGAGGASGNITVSSSSGGWSTIYAKYNSSGVLSWARATKATISTPRTSSSSLVVDENNDIYIAGWVGSGTSNFDLQFPASSTTYTNIPVPTSTTNSGYIVKLNSVNGYALWKSYARNTTTGNEAISLANGKCNFIYACINTTASPTYTDASGTVISPAISSQGLAIVPINTSGQLLTTTPWIINGVIAKAHIASSGKSTLQCVSTASSPVSLQTSGGPLTLSPSSSDAILGTITYAGRAPTVTLPDQMEVCEGTTILLDASVTGIPTFTYTWSIYDIVSGNYVTLGTSSSPSYSVGPSVYNPYIITFGTMRFVSFQVTVTDCSGLTSSYNQAFVIKNGISYTQVSGVDVCYKNQITAPNAVFSVNALNVDAYSWQYSSNGGMSWNPCSGSGYSGVNTATLTVISPTASQNNYLFRCKLGGCPTQETNAALLTVTPCPQRPAGDLEKTLPDTQKSLTDAKLSLYPNPTNTTLEVVFENGTSSDTESVISEAYILDMTGRKVRDIPFGIGHHTLEVADLQNGTYSFVVLTNGKVIDQQKFIVMH